MTTDRRKAHPGVECDDPAIGYGEPPGYENAGMMTPLAPPPAAPGLREALHWVEQAQGWHNEGTRPTGVAYTLRMAEQTLQAALAATQDFPDLDGYQKGYQAGWHDGRREAQEPALDVERLARAIRDHDHAGNGGLRIRSDHLNYHYTSTCTDAIAAAYASEDQP